METKAILIIGCEDRFIADTRNALSGTYAIQIAKTYESAIQLVKKQNFILIILGFLSPRGSSFRMHQELKSGPETKNTELIIFDVPPEEHIRKGWSKIEGMQMEADAYLIQPVNTKVLQAEVRRCLTLHLVRQKEFDMALKMVETSLYNQINNWKQSLANLLNKIAG